MADDNNHRPYRGNDAPARGPSGPAAGSDPLAELARLIGQNDPFGEFGGDGVRRTAAPRQPGPAPQWAPEPPPALSAPAPQPPAPFGSPGFGRQSFGSAPLAGQNDLDHSASHGNANAYDAQGQYAQSYGVPGYAAPGYAADPAAAGHDHDAHAQGGYDQNQAGAAGDDYYDDAQPSRRRIGIMAIAGIFALAVIGTAGAFGYRAIFGSSSANAPPPVIKADTAPSKIVPATAGKDAIANKLITDRVNERGQERLVSREEQPVSIGNTASGGMPAGQRDAQQLGSGVVGADPKKIRTIAIHPDQPVGGAAGPVPQAQPEPPQPAVQPRVINVTPSRAAAPTPAAAPATAPAPRAAAPEPAAARPPAPAPVRAVPAPANAPLSLNPNAVASAPARAAPAPRVAAVTAPPPAAASAAASGGGYAVQVSAQRSEAEAVAAFRSLQGKFPGQLGSRQPLIKQVDLGDKGIYFRAMVGPFANSGEAGELCTSLKAAGGQCIVQRN